MNKKKIIILGAAGILVIVLIALYFIFFSSPSKEKLTNDLTDMGKTFYTDFYTELNDFLTEEKVKEEVSKLSLLGVQVSLNNLNDNSDNERTIRRFRKCNQENTIVTIYPEDPFGINDYRIEIDLDCGFKK